MIWRHVVVTIVRDCRTQCFRGARVLPELCSDWSAWQIFNSHWLIKFTIMGVLQRKHPESKNFNSKYSIRLELDVL